MFKNIYVIKSILCYCLQDFSHIFESLRKPTTTLPIIIEYNELIEKEYGKFKDFIINLFQGKINLKFEMGRVAKLLTLIKNSRCFAQFHLGTFKICIHNTKIT